MIDEKKLIEVLERNFGGIGGASVLKQLIEAQPKISLENKTSDWIPVSEMMPQEYEETDINGDTFMASNTVIIAEKDGYVGLGVTIGGIWFGCGEVVAWMPLPKAYKSEG